RGVPLSARLRHWLLPQFSVFLGLSVPLLVWTGQVALVAPLANLFAIPLVGFAVVPLALLAVLLMPFSPGLAEAALVLADGLLSLLLWGLQALESWSGGPGLLT